MKFRCGNEDRGDAMKKKKEITLFDVIVYIVAGIMTILFLLPMHFQTRNLCIAEKLELFLRDLHLKTF